MRRCSVAFTLIEILLVLGILSIAALGVWRLYARGLVEAATQRTARSEAELVDAVRGEYMMSPSFSGVTSAGAANPGAQGILMAGKQIVDGWGVPVQIAPASVLSTDDAFGVTIVNATPAKCVALVPALMGDSTEVLIGGANIQPGNGKSIDGATISGACNSSGFSGGVGTITFVYDALARPGLGAVVTAPTCTAACAPQTQTQTLACPGAEVGQVKQTRSGACTGAPCPTLTWGAWVTTSSSCAIAPTPPSPPVPPVAPPAACSPSTAYRTQACPVGDVGRIQQEQSTTCVAGTVVAGPWTTVSNDCAPPSPIGGPDPGTGCSPHVVTGTQACPAGEGGQISTVQNVTCNASGNPVYGPIVPVSNTCQASCVASGTCCVPGSKSGGTQTVTCNAGQYGQIINSTTVYSTCASATAVPAWGTPQITSTSGSCNACPSPSTATQTQNVAGSAACPAGDIGSDTWTQAQQRTQTTTTTCPAGTTALPAPTVSAWSAWANVGGKIGEVNTCVPGAVPTASGVSYAAWADQIDISQSAGATSYNVTFSCLSFQTASEYSATVSTPASDWQAWTPTMFDTLPGPLVELSNAYEASVWGQSGTTTVGGVCQGAWVSVAVSACNAGGCSAPSLPVVSFCSWNEC